MKTLKIGSRKSDLAKIQAYLVGETIKALHPEINIEYVFKNAEGDIDRTTPLWKMEDKGVFTRDLSQLLLDGTIDLAVHSWKDLPTEMVAGTSIIGTIKRGDPRDMLLVKKSSLEAIKQTKKIKVLSSSPRRAYNLSSFLTWALPFKIESSEFISVRGNIPTRISKLLESEADALVLAKVALTRLLNAKQPEFIGLQKTIKNQLNKCCWIVLPLTHCPSAAAQAALAVEAANSDYKKLLSDCFDDDSFNNATKEREILKGYGGGCHQKIGATVITHPLGNITYIAGEAGKIINSVTLNGNTPLPPKADKTKLWLCPNFFQVEKLQVVQPQEKNLAFYVSKASALPDDWKIDFDTPVITAGLSTWKKLAERGIWVNGASEALGEEFMFPNELLKEKTVIKLSHTNSQNTNLLATYKLLPQNDYPSIDGKTHFFWHSTSQFLFFYERHPEIKECYHATGLGKTYTALSKYIAKANLSAWLNSNDWYEYVAL